MAAKRLPDFGPEADAAVDRECAQFPATFGLRAFPGEMFRVSRADSFVSWGRVLVYTERLAGDRWVSFAKGAPEELRAQLTR